MKALAFNSSRPYEDRDSGGSCTSTDVSWPPNDLHHLPGRDAQRKKREAIPGQEHVFVMLFQVNI